MNHDLQLQGFIAVLGTGRQPYSKSGRKFDKIFVDGEVRYFVARVDMTVKDTSSKTLVTVRAGDIYGAKSKLAPNFRWFFGTLPNVAKWDWTGHHGRPVTDKSVMEVKGYDKYKHYKRIEV